MPTPRCSIRYVWCTAARIRYRPHLHVLVEDRGTLLKSFMDKMNIINRDEMKERVAAALFTCPGKCNRHFKPLNADMTVPYKLAKEHLSDIAAVGGGGAQIIL